MSLLRLATRLPRAAARPQLRCLSGSHSDFETVRKKVPATAEGVQAMIKEQARRGVIIHCVAHTCDAPATRRAADTTADRANLATRRHRRDRTTLRARRSRARPSCST